MYKPIIALKFTIYQLINHNSKMHFYVKSLDFIKETFKNLKRPRWCKNIHIKDADSNINKYILTENTRVSKKNTAHTWRQEMRYIQSRGHLERSSSTHNGSSISKTNQSDSRLSSGGNKLFRTVFEVINL